MTSRYPRCARSWMALANKRRPIPWPLRGGGGERPPGLALDSWTVQEVAGLPTRQRQAPQRLATKPIHFNAGLSPSSGTRDVGSHYALGKIRTMCNAPISLTGRPRTKTVKATIR